MFLNLNSIFVDAPPQAVILTRGQDSCPRLKGGVSLDTGVRTITSHATNPNSWSSKQAMVNNHLVPSRQEANQYWVLSRTAASFEQLGPSFMGCASTHVCFRSLWLWWHGEFGVLLWTLIWSFESEGGNLNFSNITSLALQAPLVLKVLSGAGNQRLVLRGKPPFNLRSLLINDLFLL